MAKYTVEIKKKSQKEEGITQEDFNKFLNANTYEERLKILLLHSQTNQKSIQKRRTHQMENRTKTQQEIEAEMIELNEKFGAFLKTKGISAKFKLAFSDIAESAQKQHDNDKANFEAVKAQSAEDNKEFVEFLHTKGLKAKFNLVVENIKKGASTASRDTAAQIAKIQAQTQANIAAANAHANPNVVSNLYTAEALADEFNAFLKANGLDSQYSVVITEEE